MSVSVKELKKQLFKTRNFVCGGHGARRPSHGKFTVPNGITINFYVQDSKSLPNSVGQKVDQFLAGGKKPAAVEVVKAGTKCHNYHLYSGKAGGYLNLAMSTQANPNYITTDDKDHGIALKDIVDDILKQTPNAEVHWSACRSLENDGDSFAWSKPKYSPGLKQLGGKKS